MTMMKPPNWLTNKVAPIPSAYPNWDRACDSYNAWLTGFVEEEISQHMGISVEEVKMDIRAIQLTLPARVLIVHNNDRNRLLVQREESERYREMLRASLTTPVATLLNCGISPAGIMREFREATGQIADKGITVNAQTNFFPSRSGSEGDSQMGSGITSAEDLIRKVVETMDTGETLGAALASDDDASPPEPPEPDLDDDNDDDEDREDDGED